MESLIASVDNYYPSLSSHVTRISNSKLEPFRMIQGSLFAIGSYINSGGEGVFDDDIPTKNYDEILTNIRWINTKTTLEEIDNVVREYYPMLVDEAKDVRKVIIDLIVEICEVYINNLIFKLRSLNTSVFKRVPVSVLKVVVKEVIRSKRDFLISVASEIERGIMLYTLLIAGVLIKNVTGWCLEEFRTIYYTKANAIICSLSNFDYSDEILESVLVPSSSNGSSPGSSNGSSSNESSPNESSPGSSTYFPIELAFLKRSQMLPRLFEKIYEDRMKHYQEIGLTDAQLDFKEGGLSTIGCHKCKGFYTDYIQLQTRSADEPMTIFYRCRQCGNRGRR